MKKIILAYLLLLLASSAFATEKTVNLLITTTAGDIKVELFTDKAPNTVKNFLSYVDNKYYDGLIFHRVIDGFMVQGGGFDKDMKQKDANAPIMIESDNGLKNLRGTLAMARTEDPNSATAQFFINHKDNPFLDFKAKTKAGYGYTVFGKVISGLDVVDKIAKTKTGNKGYYQDVPVEPIIIKTIRVVR